jgi:hypothetical protein
MRTTLTLEPDVARLLEEEAHRQRKPIKQVVNEALRRGLAPRGRGRTPPRYQVKPHRTSLRPGIDAQAFNRLADELEDEAVLDKTRDKRSGR